MNIRERGFSLLETAVALVILGIVSAALFALWNASHQRQSVLSQRDLLERAEESLIAYARINSRLPCPAADSDGTESCTQGGKGYFPWKTVGLPVQAARKLRYGVFRQSSSTAMKDADLAATDSDRFAPLVTSGSQPVAVETLLGNANGIDFCQGLRVAALDTASSGTTSALYVANGSVVQNVAFALALPGLKDADGDGSAFDGLNASSTQPGFESPQHVSSTDYDDVVRTRSFGTLFGDLDCGEILSAAEHAHFNVASAASMMRQGMNDYYVQLVIAKQLAEGTWKMAVGDEIVASGDFMSATSGVESATAEDLAEDGAATAALVLAYIGEGLADVAWASSTTALTQSILVYEEAEARLADVADTYHLYNSNQDESDPALLEASILTHAKNADAAGL